MPYLPAAICVFLCALAHAQTQQFADLGDCELESGGTIRDCKIGYRSYGKLNARKSNAVLWPTWFGGSTQDLGNLIGPNRLVDSPDIFLVAVDAIGNGVSSSPSNSAVQPRMQFPKFNIRDMVNAQHRLLTEKLGIGHLRAVMGISMGGMQAFEWVAAYPDFMDCAISIAGTPQQTAADLLLWRTEARAIQDYKDWNGGNYTGTLRIRSLLGLHEFALRTPAWTRANIAPADFDAYVERLENQRGARDPNNWLRQLEAMMAHDISRRWNGSLDEVAKHMTAKMLVIAARQDHMVNPEPSLRLASLLNAETIVLTSDCGHMSPFCEIHKILSSIARFLR